MPIPHFTDIAGLASAASAAAASVLLLPGIAKLARPRLALLLGAVFVLMLIPSGGMPPAAYLRGVSGDLSITTMVLLWCALLRPWRGGVAVEAGHRFALPALIALAALVLYPLALGAGAYDPYRLGYGDTQFLAALLLVALVAWSRKATLLALCIALATLAWACGWYESDNLWDYLIDPFVAVYALATVMLCGVRLLLKLQRDRSH
ncbi:MAG TPA: hypothetical protein VLS47_08110 [Gallionella sp.]|nr:hypothetical protein [Gallionella sp.]